MIAPYLQPNLEIEETIRRFKQYNPYDDKFEVIHLAGSKYYHIYSESYKNKMLNKPWPFAWLFKGEKI